MHRPIASRSINPDDGSVLHDSEQSFGKNVGSDRSALVLNQNGRSRRSPRKGMKSHSKTVFESGLSGRLFVEKSAKDAPSVSGHHFKIDGMLLERLDHL